MSYDTCEVCSNDGRLYKFYDGIYANVCTTHCRELTEYLLGDEDACNIRSKTAELELLYQISSDGNVDTAVAVGLLRNIVNEQNILGKKIAVKIREWIANKSDEYQKMIWRAKN